MEILPSLFFIYHNLSFSQVVSQNIWETYACPCCLKWIHLVKILSLINDFSGCHGRFSHRGIFFFRVACYSRNELSDDMIPKSERTFLGLLPVCPSSLSQRYLWCPFVHSPLRITSPASTMRSQTHLSLWSWWATQGSSGSMKNKLSHRTKPTYGALKKLPRGLPSRPLVVTTSAQEA